MSASSSEQGLPDATRKTGGFYRAKPPYKGPLRVIEENARIYATLELPALHKNDIGIRVTKTEIEINVDE